MTTPFKYPRLVIQIAYSCNISCQGCITVSDVKRAGVEPTENVIASIHAWSKVFEPEWLVITGGETLLHPGIKDICRAARQAWPNAGIMIPTNGYLLDSIIDKEWVEEVKPLKVRVSLHRADHKEYVLPVVKRFMSMYSTWNPIKTNELAASDINPYMIEWEHDTVTIALTQYHRFNVPYVYDNNGNIAPRMGDAEQAHKLCGNPDTPVIYKGRMWKCFPIPNLKDTVEDFDQRWPAYNSVGPTDDLTHILSHIGKPESICTMCPDSTDSYVNHMDPDTVKVKHSIFWLKKNAQTNK